MSVPHEPSSTNAPKKKYPVSDAMIVTIAEKLVETSFQSFASDTTPTGTERIVIISHAALSASKLGSKSAIKDTLNEHLEKTYSFTISEIRMIPTGDLDVVCFLVVK